jgi:WD40 repeat protein
VLALKTSKQTVTRFAFSRDGARLAVAGSGRKVHLWDVTAKKLKAKLLPTFKDKPAWIGFLPTGELFALSEMGEYAVHDPGADAPLTRALERRWVGPIVAEPDGTAFYGTGWEVRKWAFNGRLREVWKQGIPPGTLIAGRGGAILTPDGEFIAAVSNGSNRTWLHARDPASGAFRGQRGAVNSLIHDLTLLADGQTIAFVREQEYRGPTPNAVVIGTIGEKFEPLVTAKTGETLYSSLALHPSGKWLAVGQSDGTVRLFDTETWREAVAYQWPIQPVAGLAFAPDGLRAAAGGDNGRVVVWDVDL